LRWVGRRLRPWSVRWLRAPAIPRGPVGVELCAGRDAARRPARKRHGFCGRKRIWTAPSGGSHHPASRPDGPKGFDRDTWGSGAIIPNFRVLPGPSFRRRGRDFPGALAVSGEPTLTEAPSVLPEPCLY
jgi:hypothetical protein